MAPSNEPLRRTGGFFQNRPPCQPLGRAVRTPTWGLWPPIPATSTAPRRRRKLSLYSGPIPGGVTVAQGILVPFV